MKLHANKRPHTCWSITAVAVVLALCVTPAQPATAAVDFGQTGAPSAGCGEPGSGWVTQAVDAAGAPTYSAPTAGVVTFWRHRAGSQAGQQLRLKMFRLIGPGSYLIVGESATHSIAPNVLNSFPTRVPVQAGDILGLDVIGAAQIGCALTAPGNTIGFGGGDPVPGSTTSVSQSPNFSLNVSATLEPDTDGDGFGDESQDNCVGVSNPGQEDRDSDGRGDLCDNCPAQPNGGQSNADSDGQGDACDDDADNDGFAASEESRRGTDPLRADTDGDGVRDNTDNCATASNGDQVDRDADGRGTVCDPGEQGSLRPGACANLRAGTRAGDTLTGTSAGDRLFGLRGNDNIDGLAGDDCLDGGLGADRLYGRAGTDELEGGDGNDALEGGAGRDTLSGGPGVNRYSGGAGNDSINAANGRRENVNCGAGRDQVRADRNDRVRRCERVRRQR